MYSGQTKPNVEYDRKIKYLDYMENGQRVRGAGFVKLERRDGRCNISLQVSGLYRRDHFTRPLIFICGENEHELCKLQLADGGIKTYIEGLDSHNMDGHGMDYAQINGMRIPISEGKSILCMWGSKSTKADRVQIMTDMPEAQNALGRNETKNKELKLIDINNNETKNSEIKDNNLIRSDVIKNNDTRFNAVNNINANYQEINYLDINYEEVNSEEINNKEINSKETNSRQIKNIVENDNKTETTAFSEDKWGQLWTIYPHVCPFSDDREYLSLGPSDFVVFPSRYYKLVNNSFLLHGYYNYHHLILIRVDQKNDVRYYIGVPGNLYQKEKRIAVMFGFESFECAEEPAAEGDFGYYLIPVEI